MSIGMICLAVWMILYGAFALIPGVTAAPIVLGILGIITGIFLFAQK